MMIEDIRPENNIEWLWVLDLVELSWEILRYRNLKQRVISAYREAAIESILQRLDGAGMPADASATVRLQSKQNAAQWREDLTAAAEIEARLEQNGFDATAINNICFIETDRFSGNAARDFRSVLVSGSDDSSALEQTPIQSTSSRQ